MSDSILQVNLIKNKGGTATGITVDNSNANVTVNRPLTASSGIANSGTISAGTIANAVNFPAKAVQFTQFYEGVKTGAHKENPVGMWVATGNYENTVVFAQGVVPTNYNSIIEMYQWTIPMQTGSNTYTGEFGWNIASNGEDHATHTRSRAQIFSVTLNPNDIHRYTLMEHGSSGSRFEDLLSAGDAWTMQFKNSTSRNIRFLGVSITWGLN